MSTVSIKARSSRSLMMAASSDVSCPISTRGSAAIGRPASAWCRSAWLILAAATGKAGELGEARDGGFGGLGLSRRGRDVHGILRQLGAMIGRGVRAHKANRVRQ